VHVDGGRQNWCRFVGFQELIVAHAPRGWDRVDPLGCHRGSSISAHAKSFLDSLGIAHQLPGGLSTPVREAVSDGAHVVSQRTSFPSGRSLFETPAGSRTVYDLLGDDSVATERHRSVWRLDLGD
jgi:hypothetical protein